MCSFHSVRFSMHVVIVLLVFVLLILAYFLGGD